MNFCFEVVSGNIPTFRICVLLLVLNYFVASIPFNLYNGCNNEHVCCEQTKLSFHQ